MKYLVRGCIVFIGVVAIAIFIYIVFFWGRDLGEVSSIGKGGLGICFLGILACIGGLWWVGSKYLEGDSEISPEDARKLPYYKHYKEDFEKEHSKGRFDSRTGRRR